jgi:hypothetical protein
MQKKKSLTEAKKPYKTRYSETLWHKIDFIKKVAIIFL